MEVPGALKGLDDTRTRGPGSHTANASGRRRDQRKCATLAKSEGRVNSMFRISQKTEYALRAMIELTLRREDGLVSAREISEAQHIPLRFLEQQLGALHKAELVESFRGAGGGCRLARDPAEVRVADVVDAIEGQMYPMFCLDPSDHTCFQDGGC